MAGRWRRCLERYQVPCCAHCGKRLGAVFGLRGLGIQARRHKCQPTDVQALQVAASESQQALQGTQDCVAGPAAPATPRIARANLAEETLSPGTKVIIEGLQKFPEFNNVCGTIQKLDQETGSYIVQIDSLDRPYVQMAQVKGQNLRTFDTRSPAPVPSQARVHLYMYDLLGGHGWMLGKKFKAGLWHTGIVVEWADKSCEIWYGGEGGHIFLSPPGQTLFGAPEETKLLGLTSASHVDTLQFLARHESAWEGTYHMVRHNCNHFSDFVAQGLLGEPAASWSKRTR